MNNLFINISKDNYKELVGISKTNPNYYKIAFIDDGQGIITRGQLYINSKYWIEVVDEAPPEDERKNDTIYFVKE